MSDKQLDKDKDEKKRNIKRQQETYYIVLQNRWVYVSLALASFENSIIL